MRTWKELGEEFRALVPQMPHSFLDVQWGAAGTYWNIGANTSAHARSRFEILSDIAGEKLLHLSWPEEFLDLLRKDEPRIRWFRVLKDCAGAFNQDVADQQVTDDGKYAGFIYTGRLRELPAVAANMCLNCELLESSPPQKGILEDLLNVGLNAAADHWRNSHRHRNASPADPASASREAILAVEGVAKSICSLPTATLGDCIKSLRTKKKLSHGTATCLEGLWTYSNETPGIRHGAGNEFKSNNGEIEFFLDLCASAIRLLLGINAA